MTARPRDQLRALIAKDVRLELRSAEALPAALLFALAAIVVIHFAFQRDTLAGPLAAGAFWLTLLFAAFLPVTRAFVVDSEQGGIDAVRLAGVDGTTVVAAKAASLVLALVAVETVLVPAFALLLLGPSLWPVLVPLLAVLALANVGIAVVGALAAALAALSRLRELIVPILMLPLSVPLVIGAAEATAPLFSQTPGDLELRWLLLLGLYDVLFVAVAVGVADHLIDE